MSIGFELKNKNNIDNIIVNNEFKNAIAFGKTGSGKTTTFILNNIKDRIQKKNGIIVFDFKGNLHLKTKFLANEEKRLDDVYEFGTEYGIKINLLDFVDFKSLENMFKSTNISTDFWDTSGLKLLNSLINLSKIFLDLYLFFKYNENLNLPNITNYKFNNYIEYRIKINKLGQYENNLAINDFQYDKINVLKPTFKSIYHFLNYENIIILKEITKYILEDLYEINQINNNKDLILLIKKIEEGSDFFKQFKENLSPEKSGGGMDGVLMTAQTRIVNLAEYNFINDFKEENIYKENRLIELLENQKIIVINNTFFDTSTLGLIINSLTNKLLKRTFLEDIKPISIFIDEVHKVINEDMIPETSVCRENKVEYILSVQDIEAIYINLDSNKFKTDNLLNNILYQIKFEDEQNLNEKKQFIYKDIVLNRTCYSEPIFINKEQELKIEQKYQQKVIEINKFLNKEYNNKDFIVYNEKELIKQRKVKLYFLKEKTFKIVNFYSDDILLIKDNVKKIESNINLFKETNIKFDLNNVLKTKINKKDIENLKNIEIFNNFNKYNKEIKIFTNIFKRDYMYYVIKINDLQSISFIYYLGDKINVKITMGSIKNIKEEVDVLYRIVLPKEDLHLENLDKDFLTKCYKYINKVFEKDLEENIEILKKNYLYLGI